MEEPKAGHHRGRDTLAPYPSAQRLPPGMAIVNTEFTRRHKNTLCQLERGRGRMRPINHCGPSQCDGLQLGCLLVVLNALLLPCYLSRSYRWFGNLRGFKRDDEQRPRWLAFSTEVVINLQFSCHFDEGTLGQLRVLWAHASHGIPGRAVVLPSLGLAHTPLPICPTC